jgi:hypothetical protein
MTSWNEEFIKSHKDFAEFTKWDDGRTPESELKAVWESIVPTPTEQSKPEKQKEDVQPTTDAGTGEPTKE